MDQIRQITLTTADCIVVCLPRPVNTGRISPAADEMTVRHYLHHPATVGTYHVGDAMIADWHRYLALAEATIDGTSIEVVMAAIVMSHPRWAVSSAQRLSLEDATSKE